MAEEGKTGSDGRLDEESLLDMLNAYEDDAAEFQTGDLRLWRDRLVKAYFQQPYGNEEPGWSQYRGSAVSETVEWMLPDILDQFVSNPKAVEFVPTRAEEQKPAEDATAGANYVFYQQNNGFMVLQTAFKDALMVKNCAVHWRAQTKRTRRRVPFRNASPEQVQLLLDQYASKGAKIDYSEPTQVPVMVPAPMLPAAPQMPGQPTMAQQQPQMVQATGPDGQPLTQTVHTGQIVYIDEKKTVRVDAFEPENLGVFRDWTSPLLDGCPYVVRWMEVTLSDLNEICDELGVDRVEARDLAGSRIPTGMFDDQYRRDRTGRIDIDTRPARPEGVNRDDESQTTGWLRIEWVLADWDGDGIAEQREVWRLDDKILSNEECDEIPCATGSPIIVQHMWMGMSVAETVDDLQLLETDIMRSVINNAYSASNPRKTVLTSSDGEPFVDIDDLMDGRPGGVVRVKKQGAIGYEATPFVGEKFDPLLQRIDQLREQRTGVTKQRMGMDPNALRQDRTLGETEIINQASKQRIKLIARVLAETVVKPIFRGILRLLTTGDFDQLFFRLNGTFVELDPNDWSDHYDMIANVGLGTGDDVQQLQTLKGIWATQMQLAQSPLAKMVTANQMYATLARLTNLGGFKNVSEFFTAPPPNTPLPPPPPAPPPYQIQVAQIKAQSDAQKLQVEQAHELARLNLEANLKREADANQNAIQTANDARDAQAAALKAEYDEKVKALDASLQKYKTDQDNKTKIIVARLASKKDEDPSDIDIDPDTGLPWLDDPMSRIMDRLDQIADIQSQPTEVVRHPETGEVTGVRRGNGPVRPVVRDSAGNIVGVH